MTSTIDAPVTPEVFVVSPPRRSPAPAMPATRPGRIVVRSLPPQRPITGSPGPEPVAAPPTTPPRAPGMAVARVEVRTMLQLTMEMLDGRRPRSQLGGRLSKEVLRHLAAANGRLNPAPDRRVGALARLHNPPGLHSIHLCHPAEGVTEASAVWRHRGRFRALAARFEWTDTRWMCTSLQLG
ncbi:MAG TPA: Rv3235 family protein [Pseudonocardia sp.]